MSRLLRKQNPTRRYLPGEHPIEIAIGIGIGFALIAAALWTAGNGSFP